MSNRRVQQQIMQQQYCYKYNYSRELVKQDELVGIRVMVQEEYDGSPVPYEISKRTYRKGKVDVKPKI